MPKSVEQNQKFQKEFVHNVRTLYDTRPIMFKGAVGFSTVYLAIYFSTMDGAYLAASAMIFVIFLLRRWDFTNFDKATEGKAMSYDDALHWEKRYILGSFTAVSIFSLFAIYAFVVTGSQVAIVGTMGCSMASLLAVVGRNFGSTRNINFMSWGTCVPLAAGMMAYGDIFMAIVGCVFFPMITGTNDMAQFVRRTVTNAWSSANEVQDLADQFEAALDNMAHGLFMVGPDGRIAVANRKASELLKTPDAGWLEGRRFRSLLRFARARGIIDGQRLQVVQEQLLSLLTGRSSREMVELTDNCYFDVSASLRHGKGAVLSFEDATQRIKSDNEVTRLARFDTLSGLPNRMWMAELVRKAVKSLPSNDRVLFTVFDVDRFKQINDTMGHSAGDKVIQHVGKKLAEIAAADRRVIAARLGGDEFVLAIAGLRADEDVNELIDGAYGRIVGEHQLGGKRIDVRISGGAVLHSKRKFDLDEALIRADIALYKSKKSHSTAWTLFEKEVDDSYRRKQKLAKDLREALANGGLTAAYQPMLTPDGRAVQVCEALARWTHPELGAIPPQEFIGIAEEIGVVSKITKEILRNACHDCMTWPDEVAVSANLSVIDLSNHDIVETIREAIEASGLPPHRLQVEVTETMLAADVQKTRAILAAIRGMGVKTALDDFGTGYSSLSYLHEFPVDKVKIDRSFMANIMTTPRSAQLLGAVIQLANDLGFEVVAEGIENEEQLDMVRSLGDVTLVQGYVFGRPMPTADIQGFSEAVSSAAPEDCKTARLKSRSQKARKHPSKPVLRSRGGPWQKMAAVRNVKRPRNLRQPSFRSVRKAGKIPPKVPSIEFKEAA